jgi:hypothetical protein
MSIGLDLPGVLASAGRGAAAGTILGPAGMAAGGLVGLGMAVAPELGRWLSGAKGEETAAAVASVVQAITGTDDPEASAIVLGASPQMQVDLRVKLAQISADREADRDQAMLDSFKAEIGAQQDARNMTMGLAEKQSPLAYGAAMVTMLIIGLFIWVVVFTPEMDGEIKQTVMMLTVAVVSYWVGSSRGSTVKDQVLGRSLK